ncbi:MAG: FAD-dependent oxidoreductase [Caulobacteraceae bacterium]
MIEAGDPEALLARARAVGATLEPIAADQARRLCPGLQPPGPFLFTPEDWRLEPRVMLGALHRAFRAEGGELVGENAAARSGPGVDLIVRATGPGPGLTPIKGQILRFQGAGPARGPVVRGEGIYVAPSADGVVAGATMEEAWPTA